MYDVIHSTYAGMQKATVRFGESGTVHIIHMVGRVIFIYSSVHSFIQSLLPIDVDVSKVNLKDLPNVFRHYEMAFRELLHLCFVAKDMKMKTKGRKNENEKGERKSTSKIK